MKLSIAALFLCGFSASVHADDILTFPSADLVLGQNGLTGFLESDPPTATSLADVADIVIDTATGKVFLADVENNRVLRYPDKDTLVNGNAAEYAFGQANLTSKASAFPPTATSLSGANSLALDSSGRLWVSDPDNNRVLMYTSAVTRTDPAPAASIVLGQVNFTTAGAPGLPDAATMSNPVGLHLDANGNLWVADISLNRVMRFANAASLANGATCSAVLGQASFLSSASGTSAASFSSPIDLTTDASGTLWVADQNNHRICGFPSAASLANGSPATRVLGQPDFTSTTSGRSASRISSPTGVFAKGNVLWVLDGGNNRALRFAPLPTLANGARATTVVGQPDFFTSNTPVDAKHFFSPFVGILGDNDGALWIPDQARRRVLRFDPEVSVRPTVKIKGPRRVTSKRGRLRITGKASADTSVASVTAATGLVAHSVRGLESWKSRIRLLPGRNVVKVVAVDGLGKRSRPARLIVLQR